MKTQRSMCFAFAFAFLLVYCFASNAQTRVFVSGAGSDANPCTRWSPCRTFQQAHTLVTAGGEIIALDAADYGELTITKSVSVIGDGIYAGISATAGNAVTIATAGINVTLRSLLIEGLGTASTGVNASNFATLHIESCIINRFVGGGIDIIPSGAGTRKVFIKDTVVRNNGNGINLNNDNGTSLVSNIEKTRSENNSNIGFISLANGSVATVRDCSASGNGTGYAAIDAGSMNIETAVASSNTIGVSASSGVIVISNSTVTNNTSFGFLNGLGTFQSRVNNTVAGNNGGGAQTSGTISPISGT